MSDLLDAVRKDVKFQAVMEEALRKRPVVSEFSLAKTREQQEMIVEAIKFNTAMRQGFDLLYVYLTGRKP